MKKVRIYNGEHSWTIEESTGQTLHFTGSELAEKFVDLYTQAGWKVLYQPQPPREEH